MQLDVRNLTKNFILSLIFLGVNLYGMGMDPPPSHNHGKEFVCATPTTNFLSAEPSHGSYQPYYFNPLAPQSNSIAEASTSHFSNHPDPLMADLLTLQQQGNKEGMLEVKEKLEFDLATTWFGKKAIKEQIKKVDEMLDARMTELLWLAYNGTPEQAKEAIKEIRRLSPYKYAPEFMKEPSQVYSFKLQTHVKKAGFDELSAAECLFASRRGNVLETEYPDVAQTVSPPTPPASDPSVDVDGKKEVVDVPDMPATPTNTDLLQAHITADPRTDFEEYMKQFDGCIEKLQQQEPMPEEQLFFFIKGLAQGATEHIDYIAHNPVEYGTAIVEGNISLVKSAGSLLYDVITAPEGEYVTQRQMEQYEQRIAERMESVISTYNAVSEKMKTMDSREYGKLLGKLSVDAAIAKYGGKGVGKGMAALETFEESNLVGTSFFEGIQQRLAQLTENPQMVTPEGIALGVATATEVPTVAESAGELAKIVEDVTKVVPGTGNTVNVLKHEGENARSGSNSSNTNEVKSTASLKGYQEVVDQIVQEDAFKHQYKYHIRIRERALQDPLAHNFPYSFDDIILKIKPDIQKDGSLLFRHPGALYGKEGFFEIAVNPETNTIFHRTFVGGK